ncbi:MAG: FAD-dependent oxidoreductase [Flavisolibacter sp.]|nr:FAD-dependent oxidoreductase [Flavisolibacter sp.]
MDTTIVIIGAGAAGLMAAMELSVAGKKVLVVEARNRIGGRAYTLQDTAFSQAVEAGAEFVHGDLPLTKKLLKKANIALNKAGGSFWRSEQGKLIQQEEFIEHYDDLMQELEKLKEDIPVSEFLQTHFKEEKYDSLCTTICNYVEGYYAADAGRASTISLREELSGSDEEQYRVQGGYARLMNYLYKNCVDNGSTFLFSSEVKAIHWRKNNVQVVIENGPTVMADKVIITVPLGVLQTGTGYPGSIEFKPNIPEQKAALQQLGFGPVIKILIEFDTPFWQQNKQMQSMSFVFSDEAVPTWWTQYPVSSNLLTGWCAGPAAERLKELTEDVLKEKAIQSLATIFHKPEAEIKSGMKACAVYNWATDPYTRGGYTYVTVATEKVLQVLSEPIENTLYFAGEAFYKGPNTGTVEAALQSGKTVAEKIV